MAVAVGTGVRFELEVHGEKLISRRLQRMEQASLHAKPAFVAIGLRLLAYELALFESGGASGGDRWERLEASTVREKVRKGQDPRVLHASRRLRRSLTQRGNPDQLRRSHDDRIEFGSRLPYAKYHQTGTRHMPARPPLQMTELQKRELTRILQRHIMRGA
jgi:phage gpG-like protein